MAEYWVYLMGTESPPQEAVMERVMRRKGVTPREGLLFSDIRLHSGLVLRSKNPHVFRPDLFAEGVQIDAEILSLMPRAQAFAKVRYVSEEPLKDDRHLRFLPHFAEAISTLGEAVFIYDSVAQTVWKRESYDAALNANVECEAFDFQVRVAWVTGPEGGHARTWGMKKKGLPEIVTAPSPADMAHLVTLVLEDYARKLWTAEPITTVEAYGDEFEVVTTPLKTGELEARIHRKATR